MSNCSPPTAPTPGCTRPSSPKPSPRWTEAGSDPVQWQDGPDEDEPDQDEPDEDEPDEGGADGEETAEGGPALWCRGEAGTSSAGLRSKKPKGLSQNDTVSAGITGQSSGRVAGGRARRWRRTVA